MNRLVFGFLTLILAISILTLVACKSDSKESSAPETENCKLVKITDYRGYGTDAKTSIWYLKPECNPVANQGIYVTDQGGVAPASPFLNK